MPRGGNLVDRLWSKVEVCDHTDARQRPPSSDCDCCWLWVGAGTGDGYGRIKVKGRLMLPHRLTFSMANGDIPEGWVVDHVCHERGCVRPDHLEAVESNVNTIRGVSYRDDNVQLRSARRAGFL